MAADQGSAARSVEPQALIEEFERFVEQACNDLQQAQVEIAVLHGIPRDHAQRRRWPSWTPQANTIRWGERLLDKDFGYGGSEAETDG